jgi:hypothetical protein
MINLIWRPVSLEALKACASCEKAFMPLQSLSSAASVGIFQLPAARLSATALRTNASVSNSGAGSNGFGFLFRAIGVTLCV